MPNAPGESPHQHFTRLHRKGACKHPGYAIDKTAKEAKFHPEAIITTTLTPDEWFCLVGQQDPNAYGLKPGEILTAKAWENRNPIRPDDLEDGEERLCERLPLDPTTLDVDVARGRVLAHDGRHRAAAAAHVGLKKVPTLIRTRAPRAKTKYVPVRQLSKVEKENLRRVIKPCGIKPARLGV